MISSKTFVKKTKKGTVLKVVREHYLRDDIWCGSAICQECSDENPSLEASPKNFTEVCSFPHYIIPDSNVVLHQVDVLLDPAFQNVVILQTVLQEVRHRHSTNYNRLKEIMGNADRHFYAFTNEHHRSTYIERKAGETANDRNDRAIRAAAAWYQNHLNEQATAQNLTPIKVVLLTNDQENKKKALDEGLVAFTFAEYVRSMTEHPMLIDKLAKLSTEENSEETQLMKKKQVIYPEHCPLSVIQQEIKSGKYLQGKFQASRENYLEGFVFVNDDETESVLIQGRLNLNRVVQDDIVAIQLFPKEQWTCPSAYVLEDETENPDDEDSNVEEKVIKKKPTSAKYPTGKIVGIIKRNWRPYCGILQPSPIKEATRHLFVPAERRIPKIRIETRQAEALRGSRIIVSIDSWPRDSKYPHGHFVKTLGEIGDKDTENEVLLLEHDVPHQPFSQAVLSCLPKLPWIITPEDEKVRTDLRHICICSVDPPGCTDIDDALHCHPLENGNFEVGVHIADVSHFIRPGTAIDKEAAARGTTVYLVDKRIDMVPELLSSNLCSLLGNEDRFAFSCIWEMTPEAEIVNTRFCKSIIRSRAAMTYAEAQMRIDDQTLNDELTQGLRNLNKLAKILRQRRIENGALTLASSEVRFNVDSETHDPIEVQKKELRETNSMVEEFMLLANISAAHRTLEEFPDCALLRRHPIPPVSNFEILIKAGACKGFEINVENGKALADSLEKAVLPDNHYFNVMLRMVATRCMTQALYFSSGMVSPDDYLHYGLAVPIYTHFTSPIRRYSDVIVHRLLAAAIGADSTYGDLLDKRKTQELCNTLNFRHKMGQYAGRASVHLYTIMFFKDRKVNEEGYILFVRENALQILLPQYGLETTLYLNSKKSDSQVAYVYDEKGPSQTINGITLRQFDPVMVQVSVDSSNIQHQKVNIKLVKPEIPGFSLSPESDGLKDDIDAPLQKKKKVEPSTC